MGSKIRVLYKNAKVRALFAHHGHARSAILSHVHSPYTIPLHVRSCRAPHITYNMRVYFRVVNNCGEGLHFSAFILCLTGHGEGLVDRALFLMHKLQNIMQIV